MRYLKKLFGVEEIVSVDIDSETLENNCCKVSPSHCDYLNQRPTPLTVRVFCGSVAFTHDSLVGADAVIAIELIEHLFPPELECLPFTIFGFIKPKIAIFTTPNSDFNKLFKRMSGFRHPDHKFEWSRAQFEEWAHNLIKRYPEYQVSFKGIGPGPPGSEKLGCCSQMATFIRVNESSGISPEEIHVQEGSYTLITEKIYPYFKDERTEEEKIKDKAISFLNQCKMRSRVCYELGNEIPIESVMARIRFFDKDKLKEMLISGKWELKENVSGEEVIILPESEEEDDSDLEDDEYIAHDCDMNLDEAKYSTVIEENWDEPVLNTNVESDLLCDSCNVQSIKWEDHSIDNVKSSVNSNYCTNNKELKNRDTTLSHIDEYSPSETTVPDLDMSVELSSSLVEDKSGINSNLNADSSIYATPFGNGFCNSLKLGCDSCDCSLPVSSHATKDCKRALLLSSPKEDTPLQMNSQNGGPSCCVSTLSTSCDTSIYATPYCSLRHRNKIPKCLSLQQINTFSSPAFSSELDTLKEGKFAWDQKDELSKSMEGVRGLENDLTYSSTSRVVDSGYPDSYSEHDMDMDLTPEQFDDIETESEENDGSSHSMSPPPPPPQIPRLFDDVRNGDVANNNRDGEGNNLIADIEEEVMEFEARIDEINNEVLNLAAANERHYGYDMQLSDPIDKHCGDCLSHISDTPSIADIPNDHQSETHNFNLSKRYFFPEINTVSVLNDSSDKQSLRSTKSDSSIVTNFLNVGTSECEKHRAEKGSVRDKTLHKLKLFSSLTTVMDGSCKFSNCSLVYPVEVYQVREISSSNTMLKPMDSERREPIQQEEDNLTVQRSTSSNSGTVQEDSYSLRSVYQSAESLHNVRQLQEEQCNQINEFPAWLLNLLNIQIEESEPEGADSMQSMWDSDSMDERLRSIYDVQVDEKGGGDPQRDSWN